MLPHPTFIENTDLVSGLGFAAALLTLATFAQRTMLPMRVTAIGANVCFIGYGILASAMPVLVLHVILLPTNLLRLAQEVRSADRTVRAEGTATSAKDKRDMAGLFSIFRRACL